MGLSDAPYNLIGGSADGAGNLISANGDAGILILGTGATGNQIQGNMIGTDVTGNLGLGNNREGIYLDLDCSSNLIGGSAAGNLISANYRGIYLFNGSWNVIQGNLVGTKIDGTSPLGNTSHNIELESGSLNNTIGGDGGAANRIAYAQQYTGVRIRAGSYNNCIDGNAIFGNTALGIDLGTVGITANDACDADTGANYQQNFPVLTQAFSANAAIGIRGTLNSKANSSYLLQFFASPSCDGSGNGEGQIYLGETTVTTAANCNAAFMARFPAQVPVGYVVTATATDAAKNTSEFSACMRVAAVPQVKLSLAAVSPGGSGAGGQQVSLSWTNTATGFVLKQTESLLPPILWTTVTNTPTVLSNQFTVSLPAGTGGRFYALSFE